MNKKRKIKEQMEKLDRDLAAAKDYVAKDVNVRSLSWLHLSDWKGKSGHPLWMKRHMIPSTEKFRARRERTLERIDIKSKEKQLKERTRPRVKRSSTA